MPKVKAPKEKKIPVYFTANKELKDYLENEVIKTGLPLSSVITVAINRQREQNSALETLAGVVIKLDEDKIKKS